MRAVCVSLCRVSRRRGARGESEKARRGLLYSCIEPSRLALSLSSRPDPEDARGGTRGENRERLNSQVKRVRPL
jgi:hypothetical protein